MGPGYFHSAYFRTEPVSHRKKFKKKSLSVFSVSILFLSLRNGCLKHNDFADSMSIMSVLATRYDIITLKGVFFRLCSLVVHLQSPPTPAAASALRDGKIDFV